MGSTNLFRRQDYSLEQMREMALKANNWYYVPCQAYETKLNENERLIISKYPHPIGARLPQHKKNKIIEWKDDFLEKYPLFNVKYMLRIQITSIGAKTSASALTLDDKLVNLYEEINNALEHKPVSVVFERKII